MIIALAGRRIDKQDAETNLRFPLKNVPLVKERLEQLFKTQNVKGLSCSAACGADLIALEVARELNIKCRITLSSAPEEFRSGSVTDRPGDWGKIFDETYKELEATGNVKVMDSKLKGDELYLETNNTILNQAISLAKEIYKSTENFDPVKNVLAVIVWEGASRGEDDVTADFAEKAKKMNLKLSEVLTK